MLLAAPLVAAPVHLVGSMTLGDPVRMDDGRYRVAVIIATDADSAAPQAFSFQLRFSAPVASAAVRRAGVTAERVAAFEWQSASATSLSYLVNYDSAALSMPSGVSITVAEVVIACADGTTPVVISFDDSWLTMISNQGGTMSATPANGALAVAGTTINPAAPEAVPQRRRSARR
jgi:hypothetical protein